jgi:two-component system, LytTR family, response regulator
MIHALLADPEPRTLENLQQCLHTYCPQVDIQGYAHSQTETCKLIESMHPDLLFIEKELAYETHLHLDSESKDRMTTILLAKTSSAPHPSLGVQACGYLKKPFQLGELLQAVGQAQEWIRIRKEQNCQKQMLTQVLRSQCPNNVIAIPTLEGMEFLRPEEIIRCEGLQKYTLIITKEAKDLISSHNIGEFSKLLLPHGFFSTHKSHLVNLRYIRKLSNEGDISLRDGSHVPLSRRRRRAFLDQIRQLP